MEVPQEIRDEFMASLSPAKTSMDSAVVGGPDTHETATMVRDFMERQEVSRG